MQTRYTSADQWAEAKDGVIPAPYALEKGEVTASLTSGRQEMLEAIMNEIMFSL